MSCRLYAGDPQQNGEASVSESAALRTTKHLLLSREQTRQSPVGTFLFDGPRPAEMTLLVSSYRRTVALPRPFEPPLARDGANCPDSVTLESKMPFLKPIIEKRRRRRQSHSTPLGTNDLETKKEEEKKSAEGRKRGRCFYGTWE